MRILPHRVHALRLVSGEISGVIGAGHDKTVFLGNLFVKFERPMTPPTRIEEINNRPAFGRSVG